MVRKTAYVGLLILLLGGIYLYHDIFLAKLSPGFKFEKYKTAELAKGALLKLYPVGTPQAKIAETLKKAGANVEYINKKDLPYKSWTEEGVYGAIYYDYYHKGVIFGYDWGGAILYGKDGTILSIGISRHFNGP